MNPLKEAIDRMTKDEVRTFKLFARRTQTKGERKDLALFDHVRKVGDQYDEEVAYEALYADMSKNTFHRLKSRLLGDMNRSLVEQYLETYDNIRLYHLLSVVDFYQQKRAYGLAHWFLRKAERHAQRLSKHELLDLVYTEYIRLSHHLAEINPEEYIALRRENRYKMAKIRELDDVLAAVIHRARLTQTYGPSGGELMEMLRDTVHEIASDPEILKERRLRLMMFDAISRLLLDRRDYATLEAYVSATYDEFVDAQLFDKSTHDTRLQMLTYLANARNKVGNYAASLSSAEALGREMLDFDAMLRPKYIFFYYNALVINYFKTDLDKALSVLEEMRSEPEIMEVPYFQQFIQLNIALAWNDKREYAKATKAFVRLQMLDAFKSSGDALKLRTSLAEVMVRLRLQEYEVIIQRVRQIKNDFRKLLREAAFRREKEMLWFIDKLNESLEPRKDARILKRVGKFLQMEVSDEEKDTELIDYNEYLTELMDFGTS